METETMNTVVKTAPSEKPSACLARQPILSKMKRCSGTNYCFA